jgi:hypothetical protein
MNGTTRRRVLLDTLTGAGAMALAASLPEVAVAADQKLSTGDIHDFDFFVGTWKGENRRLKKRWVGSKDWDTFPNTLICGSRLGGIVNLDYEVNFPTQGWQGMTVRIFNPTKRQWSLYWINSRTGELFPPVVGGFTGDHGEFYGDDTDDGRPIKVVFKWDRLGPGKARWQQAFSLDGKTWETNWICDHTRVSTSLGSC